MITYHSQKCSQDKDANEQTAKQTILYYSLH